MTDDDNPSLEELRDNPANHLLRLTREIATILEAASAEEQDLRNEFDDDAPAQMQAITKLVVETTKQIVYRLNVISKEVNKATLDKKYHAGFRNRLATTMLNYYAGSARQMRTIGWMLHVMEKIKRGLPVFNDDNQKCHSCQWVRPSPDDTHHRSCVCPAGGHLDPAKVMPAVLAMGRMPDDCVDTSEHAVKKGWAAWPINFDPIWIKGCLYYDRKKS